MTSLSLLKPGQRARITAIAGGGAIRQRLLDIGFLPATAIAIERVAPAGDPIWVRLQGSQISLRRREADTVLVEACLD